MARNETSLLNEYKAKQAKEERDYPRAIDYMLLARDGALEAGDDWGYCRLTMEAALLEFDLGLLDECIQRLEELLQHPAIANAQEAASRARGILSHALREKGDTERALIFAEDALDVVPEQSRELRLALQLSLVSSLAEEGEYESAWREALILEKIVGPELGSKVMGNSYWAIGNAGFLSGRIQEGRKFHELAASSLALMGDVNIWALFNKASAHLRLDAGLADSETLEFIERAEVAISVADGNQADVLEILLARAHWELATGSLSVAEQKLRDVATRAQRTFPYIRGQALQLLVGCLRALDRDAEALENALECKEIFQEAGAKLRLSKIEETIEALTASSATSKGKQG